MAQIDTRHNEKDEFFKLLVAKHFPKLVDLQIANITAKMEKEDVEDVQKRFDLWRESNENQI